MKLSSEKVKDWARLILGIEGDLSKLPDGKALLDMPIKDIEKVTSMKPAITIHNAIKEFKEKKLDSTKYDQNKSFSEQGTSPRLDVFFREEDIVAEIAVESVTKNFPGYISVENGEIVYQSRKPCSKTNLNLERVASEKNEVKTLSVPKISEDDAITITASLDNLEYINKCISLRTELGISKVQGLVLNFLSALQKISHYSESCVQIPFNGDISKFEAGRKYNLLDFCLCHKRDTYFSGNRIVITGPYIGYKIRKFCYFVYVNGK